MQNPISRHGIPFKRLLTPSVPLRGFQRCLRYVLVCDLCSLLTSECFHRVFSKLALGVLPQQQPQPQSWFEFPKFSSTWPTRVRHSNTLSHRNFILCVFLAPRGVQTLTLRLETGRHFPPRKCHRIRAGPNAARRGILIIRTQLFMAISVCKGMSSEAR